MTRADQYDPNRVEHFGYGDILTVHVDDTTGQVIEVRWGSIALPYQIHSRPGPGAGSPDGDRILHITREHGQVRGCGSTRQIINRVGWVCDGTNLMVVMPATQDMPPVVLREDLIPRLSGRESAAYAKEGGDRLDDYADHLHLRMDEGAADEGSG